MLYNKHRAARYFAGIISLLLGLVLGSIPVYAQDGIITRDTSVCRNSSLQLMARPALQYSWFSAELFTNSTIQNPVIKADSSRRYYLESKIITNNLVANHNFEDGNAGFTTTYNYCSSDNCLLASPGNGYAITSDAGKVHSLFAGRDHTSGTGLFMVVNGATPGLVIWRQTIPVIPNTNYAFGVWLSSLQGRNPAKIRLTINGVIAGSAFDAPVSMGNWEQHFAEWNSGINTVATLEIQNILETADGNDFGLDDIFFGQPESQWDSVLVNLLADADVFKTDTIGICNDSVEIDAGDGFLDYLWNNGATSRTISVSQAGPVMIKVIDPGGCASHDTVIVKQALKMTTRPLVGCGEELVLLNNGVVEGVRGKVIEFFSDIERTNQLNSSVKISTRPSSQGPFNTPEEYRAYIDKLNQAPPPAGFGDMYLPVYRLVSNNIIFNGPTQDIAYKYTIRFYAMTDGVYKFRTSFDFGRGGAIFLDNTVAAFNPADMWWNGNWNAPGQSLQWSSTLKAGLHEILIYGLENCCDGAGSAEYLAPGESEFHPFSSLAYVKDVGTYYVSLHDPVTGCTNKGSIKVTRSPRPSITVTDPIPVCKPDMVDLTAAYITTGSDSPMNYNYYRNPTLTERVLDPTTIKDSGLFYIVGQAPNNCYTETKELLVKIFSASNTSFTSSLHEACTDQLLNFTNTSAKIPGYTLHWKFGTGQAGDTSNLENPSFSYAGPGNYLVTLALDAPGSCSGNFTDSISISVKPGVGIVGPIQVCAGDQVNFDKTLETPGPYSLLWNFGDGDLAGDDHPIVQQFPQAGDYTAELIANNKGCADTARHSFTVFNAPAIGLNGRQEILCAGQLAQLSAAGGVQYAWSPAISLSDPSIAGPVAGPKEDTWYYVDVTNEAGCSARDSIKLAVIQPIQLNATEEYKVCAGEQVQFNVTGALNYQWDLDETLSSLVIANPVAIPTETRKYRVVGYSSGNCFSDTALIQVEVFDLPTVKAPDDTTITAGTAIPLNIIASSDVIAYEWSPPIGLSCSTCAIPLAQPQNSTRYTISVHNAAGCSATDEMAIQLNCSLQHVSIPNAFTPNNDGRNDVFYPMGQGIRKINYLRIYNRWGTMVFENQNFLINDKNAGWDGRVRGQSVPSQVYVYDIEMICENGQIIHLRNNISLLR